MTIEEAVAVLNKHRLEVSGYGIGSESNLPEYDEAIEKLSDLAWRYEDLG